MPKMPQIWWLKVQIRAMAKKLGVKNTFGLDKTNLIRKVQVAEGNFPCFRTAESTCSQSNCLWLEDCIGRSAANRELSRQAAG